MKSKKNVEKNDTEDIEIFVGSDNIFADFGYPDAEERLVRLNLAIKIFKIIRKKKSCLSRVKTWSILIFLLLDVEVI